ncbi:hypothetical protein PanWU01x14_291200 [Parasponia andersonii]|uniref:Uncharacterized protein n=1 Tax=Parasponia andersonii TaxID=3476 RepID=A0A2P5AXI0_PARAD|nr:hypothetical protein PanWU01x14_291200 [Parasponia andersonii]
MEMEIARFEVCPSKESNSDLMPMVADIKITKPVLCLALRKAPPNQVAMLNKPGMKLTAGQFCNRPRDLQVL